MYKYMKIALEEAKKAYDENEVPIGAVIIKDGEIIAKAHNRSEQNIDSTAHAEILALKNAFALEGISNLSGYEIYVTLEPCAMCAGAIKNAKISKVVFGAYDNNEGACGSRYDVINEKNTELYCGIMQQESSDLLTGFFKKIRSLNKEYK